MSDFNPGDLVRMTRTTNERPPHAWLAGDLGIVTETDNKDSFANEIVVMHSSGTEFHMRVSILRLVQECP